MSKLTNLITAVNQWSIDKNLHKGDSRAQFVKVAEEAGEIAAAIARSQKDELKDAIGDTFVTLIILAQQNDIELHYFPAPPRSSANNNVLFGQLIEFIAQCYSRLDNRTLLKESINNAALKLHSLALLNHFSAEECLSAAYNEIKHRTGITTEQGFIKSADLVKSGQQSAWGE